MHKAEVKPLDLFKFKCNYCQLSFSEFVLQTSLCKYIGNNFCFLIQGFECNLKIHTNVNHSNGLDSIIINDLANNQIKHESEIMAQQIEVWIEEQKDEIGM